MAIQIFVQRSLRLKVRLLILLLDGAVFTCFSPRNQHKPWQQHSCRFASVKSFLFRCHGCKFAGVCVDTDTLSYKRRMWEEKFIKRHLFEGLFPGRSQVETAGMWNHTSLRRINGVWPNHIKNSCLLSWVIVTQWKFIFGAVKGWRAATWLLRTTPAGRETETLWSPGKHRASSSCRKKNRINRS